MQLTDEVCCEALTALTVKGKDMRLNRMSRGAVLIAGTSLTAWSRLSKGSEGC